MHAVADSYLLTNRGQFCSLVGSCHTKNPHYRFS